MSKQKNGKVRTRSTALGQLRSKRVMKACINSKLELLNFYIVLCFFEVPSLRTPLSAFLPFLDQYLKIYLFVFHDPCWIWSTVSGR